MPTEPTQPLSQRRTASPPVGCLVVFGLIFVGLGMLALQFTFFRPMRGVLASRTWPANVCTVIDSQVASSSDSDGTTYRVEVRYRYTVDGREYESSRYDFLETSSSGYDDKAAIVARYPPGTQTSCYVSPTDPTQAVLVRRFSPVYLVGLFPLLFVLVGAAVVIWALRSAWSRRGIGSAAAVAEPVRDPQGGSSGPVELRPTVTRRAALLGLIFVALFWNGIVSVFVVQVIKNRESGAQDGCMTLFLVPFVLVGLGLIFAVGRQFLVLFNPRVFLTLNPGQLRPGQTAYVDWRVAGRASRVQRLRITLEGREEATYRRGTDTHTDRETFLVLPIASSEQAFEIAQGSGRADVPPGVVPTFTASHNKIVWSFKVKMEIPGWPDSEDEYEVLVRGGGES
jgi:hypothetical protein